MRIALRSIGCISPGLRRACSTIASSIAVDRLLQLLDQLLDLGVGRVVGERVL